MIINIHTLAQYPASAINLDFSGHIKTVPYGDSNRTRISSAAMKRIWRDTTAPWAISQALPSSTKSRAIFVEMVAEPLIARGHAPLLVAEATLPWIHAICGLSEASKRRDAGIDPANPLQALQRNETVAMTPAEIAWLVERVQAALDSSDNPQEVAEAAAADALKTRGNLKSLANNASIETVLFGRFASGDATARSESSVSVAHHFTTHRHQATRDALASIDTLLTPRNGGLGSLQELPIAAGTFYGYSCLSVPVMVSNLTGCQQRDWQAHVTEDASDLVERLILTIFNTTPKSGRTNGAAFSKPGLILVETGPWHQINHAEAYENACEEATVKAAGRRLADHLVNRDAFEGEGNCQRFFAALDPDLVIPGAKRLSVQALAKAIAASIQPAAGGNVVSFEKAKKAEPVATTKPAPKKAAGRGKK